jgi:hypothetical protein
MIVFLPIYFWFVGIVLMLMPYLLPDWLEKKRNQYIKRSFKTVRSNYKESFLLKVIADSIFSIPSWSITLYLTIYGLFKIVIGFIVLAFLIHFGYF